jgi:hypothetical protein
VRKAFGSREHDDVGVRGTGPRRRCRAGFLVAAGVVGAFGAMRFGVKCVVDLTRGGTRLEGLEPGLAGEPSGVYDFSGSLAFALDLLGECVVVRRGEFVSARFLFSLFHLATLSAISDALANPEREVVGGRGASLSVVEGQVGRGVDKIDFCDFEAEAD